MIGKKDQKCFSPWYGYFVILAVCVIIASAIFFDASGKHRHHKVVNMQPPPQAALQAAFQPQGNAGGTDEKLVF